MITTRLFKLLILVLAIIYVAEAGVPGRHNYGLKARQDDTTEEVISVDLPTDGNDSTDPTSDESVPSSTDTEAGSTTTEVVESTTTEAPPETTTEEQVPETSSTTTEDVPTTSDSPTTTNNEPTSVPTTTQAGDNTPTTAVTSTTEAPETTSATENDDQDKETTSAEKTTVEAVVSTSFEVITRTNSAGDIEVTTSAAVTTTTLDLNNDDGGGSGGLSENTRNIVIGVVVGIGGAIILGALGIVAWRIRARKKLAEENDGLMEYNGGYTAVDKTEPVAPSSAASAAPTGSTRSPFQSTLENYHQPTQPVNASSNF